MAASFDQEHVPGGELAVSDLLRKLRTDGDLTAADVAALTRLHEGPGGPDGDEPGDDGPRDGYPPDVSRPDTDPVGADLEPEPPPEEWLYVPEEPGAAVAGALGG